MKQHIKRFEAWLTNKERMKRELYRQAGIITPFEAQNKSRLEKMADLITGN